MGKFVIKDSKTGPKFDLLATNGQVICSSQIYKSEKACRAGIAAIQKVVAAAGVEDQTVEGFAVLKHPKFEIYQDSGEKFRFRLKAKNGKVVAVSQAYKTLKSCANGVESVKKNAPDAKVLAFVAKVEKPAAAAKKAAAAKGAAPAGKAPVRGAKGPVKAMTE